MADFPPCDPEVFKRGDAICAFSARAVIVEPWVQRVASESGHLVDWHYSGGYANVLYLGDYDKVRAAVEKLLPELRAACLAMSTKPGFYELAAFRIFERSSRGLYRAGDELPEDVVGVDNG